MFGIIKAPEPWTHISHYLVYDTQDRLIICPLTFGLHHIMTSQWADRRGRIAPRKASHG